MIVFAILFAGLAVVGALVGLDRLGHPIGSQSLDSYGRALFINAGVIAAYLVYARYRRVQRRRV